MSGRMPVSVPSALKVKMASQRKFGLRMRYMLRKGRPSQFSGQSNWTPKKLVREDCSLVFQRLLTSSTPCLRSNSMSILVRMKKRVGS